MKTEDDDGMRRNLHPKNCDLITSLENVTCA